MVILVIARGIPSKKFPLIGIFEYHQALVLSKKHDVIFLSVDLRSFHKLRHFGRRVFKHNESLSIINWSLPTLGRFTPELIFGILSNKLFAVELRRLKETPDVVHFHFGDFASRFFKSLRPLKAIKVLTEHGSNTYKFKESLDYVSKITPIYKSFDRVVAVSEPLKDTLEKYYSAYNSIIIPNMFSPLFSLSEVTKNDNFTYICVASIDENKNIRALLEAFKKEFDLIESVTLTIIGDGPLRLSFQRDYASDSIRFIGSLSREEVASEMKKAHVFALPSLIETFGVVYIEAMACGLPVIANRSGGPEFFVNDSNGIILKNHSIEELRNALRFMYQNYTSYDKNKISQFAYGNFSEDAVSLKLINLYKELMAEDK